jgi:hypothetical protein
VKFVISVINKIYRTSAINEIIGFIEILPPIIFSLVVHDWEDRPHLSPIVVVSRTAELQRAEDALGLALVAMVGGSRPAVSTAMVTSYLFERFDITSLDAEVRRHEPEEFVVRFRHREDRDQVLATRPTGAPLPLV